jgi:hypothetical protein
MVQKSSVSAPRINDWWFDLRQPASEIVRSLKATRSSIPDPSSGRRMYWRRRQGEGFGERSRGFQMASALLSASQNMTIAVTPLPLAIMF